MLYSSVFRCLLNNLSKADRRLIHLSAPAMVQVGEVIPEGELTEGTPANKVNIQKLCENKKVIIIAVPGAFTPGCSKTHVPGYLNNVDQLKKKGVDEIICISVNDAFVMDAWAKDLKAEGKIRMLADADASYTKLLNMHMNIPPLGGIRSKRYAMVVENSVVKKIQVEPDGTGLTCSLAENLIL